MLFVDLFLKITESALNQQNKDGYVLAGHNGPHCHTETSVRNSSHWLIAFAKSYKLTNKAVFRNGVCRLAELLLGKEARPYGYSFYHRDKEGYDKCNGLIGQAWTFEALAEASLILGDNKYAQIAEDVFFQHAFNDRLGLWNRLEVDGRILPLDGTFNHQLWFAACAALLKGNNAEEISRRVKRFIDSIPDNMSLFDDGLIYHKIKRLSVGRYAFMNILNRRKQFVRFLSDYWKNVWDNKYMETRCVGYHSFNMYAFAMLKEMMPKEQFFNSEAIKKAVNYMLTEEYTEGLNGNKYGYPYNSPGFEVPYSLNILSSMGPKELFDITQRWVREQVQRCYNDKTYSMDRNTNDPATLTARIYEITRLPMEIFTKIEV